MCQTTYKPHHMETINNDRFAKTYWDLMVNHKQHETAIPMIQKALNSIDDININIDGVSGSSTISAINNLNQEQLKQLNNTINEYRENFINTEVRPMFRKDLSTRNKNLKW